MIRTELVTCSGGETRAALHEAGRRAARRAIYRVYAACGQPLPTRIQIKTDALGKPYGQVRAQLIPLSISHVHPFALASATLERGVLLGADIERVRDFAPTTYRAFATPRECAVIEVSPPDERPYLRTLAWVLKESVLKALGTGLRIHPRSVDISPVLLMPQSGSVTITICGQRQVIRASVIFVKTGYAAATVALQEGAVILADIETYGIARGRREYHRRSAPVAC